MSHPAASLSGSGVEAALLTWSVEPAVIVPVVAAAAVYLRGWVVLRRRMPERFTPERATAFVFGLGAVLLALCSPIDALGHRALRVHMVQHLLLMLAAPPLLWLGFPLAPLLAGLPRSARRAVASGLARPGVRRVTARLADPRVAWIAFALVFWGWHAPALFDRALGSDGWHHVEHACFFLAALLFWRAVILPWPARADGARWAMVLYLLLAEAQATALSALLTFSDRVIYPAYGTAPALGGMSALEDQAVAGVIMWVPGSVVFTIALCALILRGLSAQPGSSSMPVRIAAAATTEATAANGRTATSAGQRV